jgi:thioredoxin 2
MAPNFAAATARLEPAVRFLKLNSEAEPEAAGDLGVSGIPALILFKDGKILARTAGLMSADKIVAWTRQALARVGA